MARKIKDNTEVGEFYIYHTWHFLYEFSVHRKIHIEVFWSAFFIFKDTESIDIFHLTYLLRVLANITIDNVCALSVPLKMFKKTIRRDLKQYISEQILHYTWQQSWWAAVE